MKPELQAALFGRHSKLFRKPGKRLHDDAAAIDERGIECGDGWFDIVDRLSRACEKEIETLVLQGAAKECWPRVAQIKQKLGTVRFYVRGQLSDDLRQQISREHSDEGESARTCERCGAPRKARDGSLLDTYCDHCDAELAAGSPAPIDRATDRQRNQPIA